MTFRLESANVFEFLLQQKLCDPSDALIRVERLTGKNLNLLVQLSKSRSKGTITDRFLVKQGPLERTGTPKEDFQEEWRIHELLCSHDELSALQAFLPEAVIYDAVNAILVYRYLERYQDLGDFYSGTNLHPSKIATALGISLATIHQATFQRQEYQLQLDPKSADLAPDRGNVPNFLGTLENLTPELFQRVSIDGLQFYKLFQRSEDLSKAIKTLEVDYKSCCLIHNDLKFCNILLHHDWSHWQPRILPGIPLALCLPDDQGVIRMIDWEHCLWGDPALDVGALVAAYLMIWLKSLMLSRDIELGVALRLAAVPLERLQPSLQAFLHAYLATFPRILEHFPGFVERVLRFAGLGLIGAIQDRLYYRDPFGNLEVSMLQVAKSLLCHPEAAVITIFGRTTFDPSDFDSLAVVTEATMPIPSNPEEQEPLSEMSMPDWVRHYSQGAALADLIKNIQIMPPLIEHPAYASLDLTNPEHGFPPEYQDERYSSLPDELRRTYLLRQLRNYLYDIYFSGEQESRWSAAPQKKEAINNTVAGLDVDFFDKIKAANNGTGFFDHNWTVIQAEGDRAQVEKDGLRLWVNPAVDLAIETPSTDPLANGALVSLLCVGTPVCLRMPNSYLVGESYMAIGNAGEPAADKTCIHLFFNVDAEGAIILMRILTLALNRLACPFTFQILTDPLSYKRYNPATLELEAVHYACLRSVLEESYTRLRSHLGDPIPLFTQPIAPGIGLAESPEDEKDFGLARCKILAQALLKSPPTPKSRHWTMQLQFAQCNLDWQRPHLNPSSAFLYLPLDISVLNDCDQPRTSVPTRRLSPKGAGASPGLSPRWPSS